MYRCLPDLTSQFLCLNVTTELSVICSRPARAVWIFGTIRLMTRIGIMPEQGDIVLIPIPFTDLSSQKRRPVIVISNNQYNAKRRDVVVVAMTSNPQPTDYSFLISSSDLVKGTLNRSGKIRVDKIYTMSQTMIAKTFGRVSPTTLDRIRTTLQDMVSTK